MDSVSAVAGVEPPTPGEDEVFDMSRVPRRTPTLHRESEMEAESPTRQEGAAFKMSPRTKRAVLYARSDSERPNSQPLCGKLHLVYSSKCRCSTPCFSPHNW